VRFVTRVQVSDFRSLAAVDLEEVGDIVPLVGLNGSGKSNLLRALNVFFTGMVEADDALDLRRDFREPKRKVKRRIAIEVDLDFGVFDSLRPEYEESLEKYAEGEDEIAIRKEWTLHAVTRDQVLAVSAGPPGSDLEVLEPEEIPYITRLLSSVRFRYIPNHVHPSQILQFEQEAIRKVLFDRLGKKGDLTESAVKALRSGAGDLMAPITASMAEATGEIGAVELATPDDWRDVAWTFGLRMQGSQSEAFEALMHGSGVQSVLAYQILHLLDTSFGGSFGWRKGAIWAVEEPESFLHARLQGELARNFSAYAEGEPLQIFLTTHAASFLGIANSGGYVSLDDGKTSIEISPRRALIRAAYSAGASVFAHPLHTGPPKPLLLVEGETDRDLLLLAYRLLDRVNPYEILCLADFDDSMKGGDQIRNWLRYHRNALEARPEGSPLLVLLDWEAKDDTVEKLNAELARHPTSRCLRAPVDYTNRDLNKSWVGIERFFSTSYIEWYANRFEVELLAPANPEQASWRYGIDKKDLEAQKPRLHSEVQRRQRKRDVAPLAEMLDWLNEQIKEAPPLL
jgi:predicted ATPase